MQSTFHREQRIRNRNALRDWPVKRPRPMTSGYFSRSMRRQATDRIVEYVPAQFRDVRSRPTYRCPVLPEEKLDRTPRRLLFTELACGRLGRKLSKSS